MTITMCASCDYGDGDFVMKFVGNTENILDHIRAHDVILKTLNCSNCSSECRIDKSCAKGHEK